MKTLAQLLTEKFGDMHLITELFLKCHQVSTYSHYCHLTTNSYASHMAFGEFYEKIIPLIDTLSESAIGKFGQLETIQANTSIQFQYTIQELRDWIESNRKQISDSSELQNIIDEIVELCNSTLYKLENLH